MNLSKQSSFEFLVLLLLTDLVICGIHFIANFFPGVTSEYWSIAVDRGFGETFQYIKELWLIFSFIALTRLRSDWRYLSLSLLFFYLFLDDLLFVHERGGRVIARWFNFPSRFARFGLGPEYQGEIVVSLGAASFFAVMIGIAYWLGNKTFRHTCHRIAVLVAGLAACGVVIDALHSIFAESTLSTIGVFDFLEDGGEMFFMSMLCWYGVAQLRRELAFSNEPIVSRLK